MPATTRSSRRLHSDRRARDAKAAMWAAHGGRGCVCWICGHHGATDADLIVPRAVAPDQPLTPAAYRPSHGVAGCPTCGRKCNQQRGARPVDETWHPRIDW